MISPVAALTLAATILKLQKPVTRKGKIEVILFIYIYAMGIINTSEMTAKMNAGIFL